jgi:hypothetical protein
MNFLPDARSKALAPWAIALAVGIAVSAAQEQRSPASVPERLAEMRHHFVDVGILHAALIRGDVASVHAPARALTVVAVPAGVTGTAVVHVGRIRTAAQYAADTSSLRVAAVATASMLRQCGECHLEMGVVPPIPMRSGADIGGIVGHMLEHQRAADDLLSGLIVPSTSAWRAGAERLRAAPLHADDLPVGRLQARDLLRAEDRVHTIATRALAAEDPASRAGIYAELLTTCSECHRFHQTIWGPVPGR